MLSSILLSAAGISVFAQDILLADFEEPNYVWLTGGNWTATGTAFGTGPAQGTLPNQNPVDGYLGNGLVNSFLNGDGSTGTLTSPTFTIQRNYLKFLIGGGNTRGQTCMNLLVNGQVVRSAVGMGDREHLDWLQWNVSSFSNQTAQLQIVDSATGGWGHINVDQIMATDTSLSSVLVATNHYLNLPIRTGAAKHLVELLQHGLVVREMNVELADTATNFWAFMDLTPLQGQELIVRVDSQLATANQLATYFLQTNSIITDTPVYQETFRPIYHYTARRGWLNDPNGLDYYNGEYHLCYQHNPYGYLWDNMHWGNAVSTDLVHWTELPEAIYPIYLGAAWSGSSVVDWSNTAGFGAQAIVSLYTTAAGHSNNPRMSAPYLFSQSLAYSTNLDRTFIEYTNNPVLPNVAGDNRDPKVFWYAPANKWVMVLWLQNNDYGIFGSADLKHWTRNSTVTLPNTIEVPELFSLPVNGDTNNMKWIFYGGAGSYEVGTFDGNTFTAQFGPFSIRGGNSFAATQTFNDIPASDGRRILIVHGTAQYPGMPFNNEINLPVVLTLVATNSIPVLYVNPVREIALLRTSTNTWPAQALANGVDLMSGTAGEAFELDSLFQPGSASQITFTLRGTPVVYDNVAHQISCAGVVQTLNPSNGTVHLRIFSDRGIIEIFGNDGQLYMPVVVTPTAGSLPVSLVPGGSGAQLLALNLYNLGSAWPAAPPYIATQPGPASTVNLGGPASFSVTATGTTVPLYYQWYTNGQAISGATNSVLSVFPVLSTNVDYYVVVSNAGGSVTSSVVALTVLAPYPVADWQMEAQITAPNNAGSPAFAGVADSATNVGEGIYTTGTLPAAIDDLITFNGLTGGPVTLSTNVAPASMFVNGHHGGNHSYNAEALTNVDGCLFFPQDQYGDELDFTGPFSVELFFKADGNRSGAGLMQLIAQGTDTGQTFRYGVDVNAAGPGGVRFKIANSALAETSVVDLTGANAADGQWHYLLAVCDTLGGANGQMRLTIANVDGSQATATNNLPAGFLPLPAGNNGNLFLGRNTYPVSVNPETFLGLIGEVQITAGVVPDSWRIGKVPSVDNHPQINNVSAGTNGISFQWTGAAATNFLVQWDPQLGAGWQTITTLPSATSLGSFTDTNASRLTNPTGFYRILAQ
ncbi:MAG: GH32 C-terminal domain-containing protein [Verrucomicrobiia bacterium]